MASQKITELTAATTASDDDVVLTTDDPAGTPTSKKITWANLKTYLRS
jgi:hypothetical protein